MRHTGISPETDCSYRCKPARSDTNVLDYDRQAYNKRTHESSLNSHSASDSCDLPSRCSSYSQESWSELYRPSESSDTNRNTPLNCNETHLRRETPFRPQAVCCTDPLSIFIPTSNETESSKQVHKHPFFEALLENAGRRYLDLALTQMTLPYDPRTYTDAANKFLDNISRPTHLLSVNSMPQQQTVFHTDELSHQDHISLPQQMIARSNSIACRCLDERSSHLEHRLPPMDGGLLATTSNITATSNILPSHTTIYSSNHRSRPDASVHLPSAFSFARPCATSRFIRPMPIIIPEEQIPEQMVQRNKNSELYDNSEICRPESNGLFRTAPESGSMGTRRQEMLAEVIDQEYIRNPRAQCNTAVNDDNQSSTISGPGNLLISGPSSLFPLSNNQPTSQHQEINNEEESVAVDNNKYSNFSSNTKAPNIGTSECNRRQWGSFLFELSSVAKPVIDTRFSSLSTVACPVINTSFSSLSKVAKPEISTKNRLLEMLAPQDTGKGLQWVNSCKSSRNQLDRKRKADYSGEVPSAKKKACKRTTKNKVQDDGRPNCKNKSNKEMTSNGKEFTLKPHPKFRYCLCQGGTKNVKRKGIDDERSDCSESNEKSAKKLKSNQAQHVLSSLDTVKNAHHSSTKANGYGSVIEGHQTMRRSRQLFGLFSANLKQTEINEKTGYNAMKTNDLQENSCESEVETQTSRARDRENEVETRIEVTKDPHQLQTSRLAFQKHSNLNIMPIRTDKVKIFDHEKADDSELNKSTTNHCSETLNDKRADTGVSDAEKANDNNDDVTLKKAVDIERTDDSNRDISDVVISIEKPTSGEDTMMLDDINKCISKSNDTERLNDEQNNTENKEPHHTSRVVQENDKRGSRSNGELQTMDMTNDKGDENAQASFSVDVCGPEKLDAYKLYLQSKKDLQVNVSETEPLEMFPELLPVPSSFNATTKSEVQTVSKTPSYSPTIEDFEHYQKEIHTRINDNSGDMTYCQKKDYLSQNMITVPDRNLIIDKENDVNFEKEIYIATPLRDDSFQSSSHDASLRDCNTVNSNCENNTGVSTALNSQDIENIIGITNLCPATVEDDGTFLDDIVNSFLAEETLTSTLTDKAQGQDNQTYSEIDLNAPNAQNSYGNSAKVFEDNTASLDNGIAGAGQNSAQPNCNSQRPHVNSSKIPKHRFNKKLPASYARAKPQKSNSMEKHLREDAEAFLGDFNEKDKRRSCREKKEKPQPVSTKSEKKKSVCSGSNSNHESAKSITKGEKVVKKRNSKDMEVEEDIAEQTTPEIKKTTIESKIEDNELSDENISKIKTIANKTEDNEQDGENTGQTRYKTIEYYEVCEEKEDPPIPALKLRSVQKMKKHWTKMWSVNRSDKPTSQTVTELTDVPEKNEPVDKCKENKPISKSTPSECSNKHNKTSEINSHGPQQEKVIPKANKEARLKGRPKKKKTIKDEKIHQTSEKDQHEDVSAIPPVEVFTCKLCGFKTTNTNIMTAHIGRNHKLYCRRCDRLLESPEALRLHRSRNHDVPLHCTICNTTYISHANYARHLRSQMHQANEKKEIESKEKPPSVTCISSDEDDMKEVYIIEDSETNDTNEDKEQIEFVEKEQKEFVEKEQKNFVEKEQKDFVERMELCVGRINKKGTFCKVCKLYLRHFSPHCRTSKHINNFEKSNLYKRMVKNLNNNNNTSDKKGKDEDKVASEIPEQRKKDTELAHEDMSGDDSDVFICDSGKEDQMEDSDTDNENCFEDNIAEYSEMKSEDSDSGENVVYVTTLPIQDTTEDKKPPMSNLMNACYMVRSQPHQQFVLSQEHSATHCSPTMLVKNVSAVLDGVEGTQRISLFNTYNNKVEVTANNHIDNNISGNNTGYVMITTPINEQLGSPTDTAHPQTHP